MRDAAGQYAEGFEFLQLQPFPILSPAFGDVPGYMDDPLDRPAGSLDGVDRHLEEPLLSVRRAVEVIGPGCRPRGDHLLEGAGVVGPDAGGGTRVREFVAGPPQGLVARQSISVEKGLVGSEDAVITDVQDQDVVLDAVEDGRSQALGAVQFLFRPFAFSDVLGHAFHGDDPPPFVEYRGFQHSEPMAAAVLMQYLDEVRGLL